MDKVHYANNILDIVTFHCAHDDNATVHYVGEIIQQGDLLGATGTTGNVTGDHLHFNTARGTFAGFYNVGTGHYQLRNAMHVYDTCFVNDTVIKRGFGHNWQVYNGGITPDYRKFKFKWVLYDKRIKANRNV